MSAPNYSARGGMEARKIAKQERLEGSLYERQALTDYAQKRAEIQSEAIPCSMCGESVHPDNMDAHMLNRHDVETVEVSLTSGEKAQLEACENIIERGIWTYIEVGDALLTIRDQRLYRDEYTSFNDYCIKRWKFSKTHANRLIDASEVAGNLTPIGVIPANEAQARVYVGLDQETQILLAELVEATAPASGTTAAHIKTVKDYLKTVLSSEAVEDEYGNQFSVRDIVTRGIKEQHHEKQQRAIEHSNTDKAPKQIDLSDLTRSELSSTIYHANELIRILDGCDGAKSLLMKLSDARNQAREMTKGEMK